MLQIASFLPDNVRRSLARTERFLRSHGFEDGDFAVVASATPPDGARYVVDYGGYEAAGDLDATFTRRGLFATRMGLRDAERALATLAADRAFREAVEASSQVDDLAGALRRFGFDPDRAVRPEVAGWSGASAFVAPEPEGFAFFLVEERGAIEVLARSETPLGVAFAYAASRVGERIDVVGRLVESDRAAAA